MGYWWWPKLIHGPLRELIRGSEGLEEMRQWEGFWRKLLFPVLTILIAIYYLLSLQLSVDLLMSNCNISVACNTTGICVQMWENNKPISCELNSASQFDLASELPMVNQENLAWTGILEWKRLEISRMLCLSVFCLIHLKIICLCNQWTEKDIGTGNYCLCSEYFQHHQAAPILLSNSLTEPNFIFQNAKHKKKLSQRLKVMGSNHSHWLISQSTNSLAQQHEKTVKKTKVMVGFDQVICWL
jgi:hypothetical protein